MEGIRRPDRFVFKGVYDVRLRWSLRCFILLALMVCVVSCGGTQEQKSQPTGIYHLVKKGETAYSIARAYGISLEHLAKVNHIKDVSRIRPGDAIFIPEAKQVIEDVMDSARGGSVGSVLPETKAIPVERQVKPVIPVEKPKELNEQALPKPPVPEKPVVSAPVTEIKPQNHSPLKDDLSPPGEKPRQTVSSKSMFIWPVRGTVKTHFGTQPNKTFHNWIKISCLKGAKIRAAAAGEVIFSANLKDFGQTIIVRHANGYATVYASLGKRQAESGQTVKKGDVIGVAGTDKTGAGAIHFEIRLQGQAKNPLSYLP